MPRFSVIIPAYNAENTLKRTVESVTSQSLSDFEVIVINDGSTDSTAIVIAELTKNSRISSSAQQNSGVSAARNAGVGISKGDWIVFLDSDDELDINALSNFNLAIVSNPKMDFWQGGVRRIGNGGIIESISTSENKQAKLAGTFCLRKSLFEEIDGYDERIKFSENSELFHRIAIRGRIGGFIKEATLNYYNAPTGGSKNLQNMIDSLSLILDKHQETLSSHVKYLYHQIIGVNYMRFRDYSSARRHLWKAVSLKPLKVTTLVRFLISLIPPVAKTLYPREVKI